MDDIVERLRVEIKERVGRAQEQMRRRGYDALIVYGNNKLYGSLRYLTDYFPDRAGWISFSGRDTYIYDGAAAVVPPTGGVVLLLDPGLMIGREVCVEQLVAGGIASQRDTALSAQQLATVLRKTGNVRMVGIETWDRFPAPLFAGLRETLPGVEWVRSTVVEEARMTKTRFEVQVLRGAAEVGDVGHRVIVERLREQAEKITELQLIREAEYAMRSLDPVYEDSCTNSPSLVSSGLSVRGSLLCLPNGSKVVHRGDLIHWDICTRYAGYDVDTSRTKVVGKASVLQKRAYDATLLMLDEVVRAARPGVPAVELVNLAQTTAHRLGFELWDGFLGHGIGLDAHERPDLVREETPLAANMVLAIEPRVVVDGQYVIGVEDMVLITESGGETLTRFEKASLDL